MAGETGLGWDATKGTIDASDDWWDRKSMVHILLISSYLEIIMNIIII
jgi:hypothetical protein